ncbi:MAG TPA: hypothetical protein VGK76_08690 [Candidatus Eisenbacteria bacterium]|jgi:hypothetical protein
MKRIERVFPSVLLFLGLILPSVAAAKPTFKSGTATITDGELKPLAERVGFHGGLLVCFVETGLGGNAGTNYLVTANATATYECINNGGNNPQAENKGTVAGPVAGSGTFTSGTNGRVEECIPVAPLDPGDQISCTPGMILFLSAVSYTNVVITDTTNGVSLSIPGTFSLTFPAP